MTTAVRATTARSRKIIRQLSAREAISKPPWPERAKMSESS